MFHTFLTDISGIECPRLFTYPFCYTPHPLSVLAAKQVQQYLQTQTVWEKELAQGKMFGVLVVKNTSGEIGFLAAFSGILAGRNHHPYFVPPVYDLLQPDGFFKLEEQAISQLNSRIHSLEEEAEYLTLKQQVAKLKEEAQEALLAAKQAMKVAKLQRDAARSQEISEAQQQAMIHESQFQKAEYKRLEKSWQQRILSASQALKERESAINQWKDERKQRSAALQQRLFEQFDLLNAKGERKNLCIIFEQTVHRTPPAGAGECAAPKLLQYAYLQGYQPLAMAEFWWGNSPKTEIRQHGLFYPSCQGKCAPILSHMLQGLEVEPNPLQQKMQQAAQKPLEILYEDEWIVAVNKPTGMLSVPGKEDCRSVYDFMHERYPDSDSPLIVHRLDMDTSGVLLIAKTKQMHQTLQKLFHLQQISKRYVALVEGRVKENQGIIELPLIPDLLDRPRQKVDKVHGKKAISRYEVIERTPEHTRLALYPLTGRTHQLRVHTAHPYGLHCPIVGDALYGTASHRLYLHAETVEFIHPILGENIRITAPVPF